MKEIISNSGEETIDVALKIAPYLKTGDVIVLERRTGFWKN